MELTLVVPALAGAVHQDGTAARLPALEVLLARADRRPAAPPAVDAFLCDLFGLGVSTPAEVPAGPLCRLADSGGADDGWWLHADPVHLLADQDRLYLALAEALPVRAAEASHLVQELNRLYRPDGLLFEAPHPNRWYLRLPAPGPATTPTRAVLGHHLGPFLPGGGGGIAWHALLNEVQMLFHASPVNRERERDGRPAINSLWLWGGGRLPELPPAAWERVLADDCLTRGLALRAGLVPEPRPAQAADALAGGGPVLVVDERLRHAPEASGPEQRRALLADLERHWFVPLADALRGRRLERLRLHLGGAWVYESSRGTLRRWWRRARRLSALV